jgi:hypothetical protein
MTAWFTAGAAAEHLCISKVAFVRRVRDGLLPAPSYALGPKTPRWAQDELDAVMGGDASSADPSIAVAALAQAIKAKGPRRQAHAG